MRVFPTFFLLILSLSIQGQKRQVYFPIWTYHQKNIDIYGISIGLGSIRTKPFLTNTYGLKLELIGAGILVPLVPRSPVAEHDSIFQQMKKDTLSERINGISLSASGTVCDCLFNGVSAGFVGQIQYKVNGVSLAVIMNFVQIHNGIQLSMLNESYEMSGLQIGLFNKSRKTRGFQIGLWNVNEFRKFPLINWNFRK